MQRNSPVFPPQVVWGQWICILHYSDLHILDVWEHAVSRLLRECIMKIELQNAKFKNHSRWALILDFIEHYFIRNRSILYTLSPHFYLFWLWFEKTNLVDDLLKTTNLQSTGSILRNFEMGYQITRDELFGFYRTLLSMKSISHTLSPHFYLFWL